jgi:hypothetical protein
MAEARDWRELDSRRNRLELITALTNVEVLGAARALLRIENLPPKVSPMLARVTY